MESVTIKPELVNDICEALERHQAAAEKKVTNVEVVVALQYVTACVERGALKRSELH